MKKKDLIANLHIIVSFCASIYFIKEAKFVEIEPDLKDLI